MSADGSKTSRRHFLFMLGVGAGTLAAADTLFARQFARDAMAVKLPAMIYDPELQVMVDPETREPLYSRAAMMETQNSDDKQKDDKKDDKNKTSQQSKKKAAKADKEKQKPLPTVTAGCNNCPKCDDHCG